MKPSIPPNSTNFAHVVEMLIPAQTKRIMETRNPSWAYHAFCEARIALKFIVTDTIIPRVTKAAQE